MTNGIINRSWEGGILFRLRRVKKDYEVDTKRTLEKAIENLQELAEEVHKRAISKYLSTEVRQKWARIEGYIYQTINGLTKTYDARIVQEKLEELTRIVEEDLEKDRISRGEDQRAHK